MRYKRCLISWYFPPTTKNAGECKTRFESVWKRLWLGCNFETEFLTDLGIFLIEFDIKINIITFARRPNVI